jgi:hypothetical protein
MDECLQNSDDRKVVVNNQIMVISVTYLNHHNIMISKFDEARRLWS